MARIAIGTYAFRYPLGGNLSWTLQWAVGLLDLGHDVVLVEKSGYARACFDPIRLAETDDCSYALTTVPPMLERFGLGGRWSFVDRTGRYFGMGLRAVQEFFRTADLFIDLGTHGAWLGEAKAGLCVSVLVDGEPGYTQMRRELKVAEDEPVGVYDKYFSNGLNLAHPSYAGPTSGLSWKGVLNPVVVRLFRANLPPRGAPFTTVMNWQSHDPLEFRGVTWGQKDVEFARFEDLPQQTTTALELAIAGSRVPTGKLHAAGWITRDAIATTRTLDAFVAYIERSAGEFSVCKQAYVALRTGWFSDRSAAYLASGRPVVMQDTGIGEHLPCGQGLFAVATVDEAADALNRVAADYPVHSRAARGVATEYLAAHVVLKRFLDEVGL